MWYFLYKCTKIAHQDTHSALKLLFCSVPSHLLRRPSICLDKIRQVFWLMTGITNIAGVTSSASYYFGRYNSQTFNCLNNIIPLTGTFSDIRTYVLCHKTDVHLSNGILPGYVNHSNGGCTGFAPVSLLASGVFSPSDRISFIDKQYLSYVSFHDLSITS